MEVVACVAIVGLRASGGLPEAVSNVALQLGITNRLGVAAAVVPLHHLLAAASLGLREPVVASERGRTADWPKGVLAGRRDVVGGFAALAHGDVDGARQHEVLVVAEDRGALAAEGLDVAADFGGDAAQPVVAIDELGGGEGGGDGHDEGGDCETHLGGAREDIFLLVVLKKVE